MSQPKGGSGGATAPGIRTTRLIERALRERWPIPKALRKPLIERLNKIVQDTGSSPREVTSAAKAILSASKLNLETITAAIKADEHENLRRELAALEELVKATRDGDAPPRRIIIPDADERLEREEP
jgi:hypothetical protein